MKNLEELKILVFEKNQADKRNKDKLFKLAKASNDIKTIEKLRDVFGFKSAMKFLLTLEETKIKVLFLNIDLTSIENALNNGIDINIQNEQGMSFLHIASQEDNRVLVKYLIDNNANIDIQDKEGTTPLLLASQSNNYEIMKILIQHCANINLKSIYGYTPLMSAVSILNNIDAVELLIKNGADINVLDKTDTSPLIMASQNNYESIVKKLIEYQANPNFINNYGYNALHMPCEKGHQNIVQFLLNTKVDINLQDKDGDTPLMLASKNGFKNIVELLLSRNVKVDLQNENGDTAIMKAIYNNHFDVVRLLVKNHANLNLKAKDKATALSFAFQNGNKELTKFLINNGANTIPLLKEKEMNSILLNSSANGDEELIQLLLDNGANINYQNEYGNTPLILASGTADNLNIVEILINNNADLNLGNNLNCNALFNASKSENIDIVKLLLESKANPNIKDSDGLTILYRVILDRMNKNDLQVTTMKKVDKNNITFRISRLLLKYHANPNIQHRDGTTVLNLCTRIGDIEMVELLLDYGAKMDIQDAFGITPLMSSVGANHLKVSKILLNYGANINLTSSSNNTTALSCAIENNNLEMVKLLVKSGADLSIKSSSVLKINQHLMGVRPGHIKHGTPEQIAKEYGFTEIETFLATQNKINERNKLIENLPKGKIQLEHNLSIEIYNHYLLFKSKVGNEIFENRYNKIEDNKFFNEDKGYIVISKNNVKKISLLNEIIDFPFTSYSGVILDINTNHNPEALSKLLQKFSSDERLKYTNHTFDKDINYDTFMNDLRIGFGEISNDLNILTTTLYKSISDLLFSKDETIQGWSSTLIKNEIEKGNLKGNLINELQEKVKKIIVVKPNDKKNKLLKRLIEIKKELKKVNDFEIEIDLDYLKEHDIDKFFTDTQRFEQAIKTIFQDINENMKDDNKNVVIEADEIVINNIKMIEIRIIHINSCSSQSSQLLKETINTNGGNFKSIYDNLLSVCDWSIDTVCSDGRYRIDYLYPQIDNNKPHCNPIEDTIRGFTHILRFYK